MSHVYDKLMAEHGIDPEKNAIFECDERFGTDAYFTKAIEAGYYGVDSAQYFAFCPVKA